MPSAQPLPETVFPDLIGPYLDLSLYLLVLTAFGMLASTGGLDTATLLFVGLALVARGYLLAHRRTAMLSERSTNILTLLYGGFYLADYFVFSREFLRPTVHLVLFLTVLRLFSLRRDRDRYFLAVIAFLMVLSAAVLTVEGVFLLAFAGFTLIAVITFVLMEMRHTAANATALTNLPNPTRIDRHLVLSFLKTTPVIALLVLIGASAIFFVLPRVSARFLTAYAPSNEIATGFSDRVELGRIGEIQQSNSVVMHVKIDGDITGAHQLMWRGVALGMFNGKTWFNAHEQHRASRMPDGRFVLRPYMGVVAPSTELLHYHVLMESIGTNVFFLAPTAQFLQGNYQTIAVDGGGAVFNMDGRNQVAAYEGWSNITRPSPDDLRSTEAKFPPEVLLNYLQLPPLDPRIPRLAEEISASASNNYDRAAAIEMYLRTKFGYTLVLPRRLPHDPLANFLFERKQGHCEYFASAMAVMLRSLKIPSRVVNGFQTTEFNDVSSQYVVRASSAHSWVEAYFPGVGWMSFDPTPPSSLAAPTGWGRGRLYLDAMASFWREWVINYDAAHQSSLGREASRNSQRLVYRTRRKVHHFYRTWLDSAREVRNTVSHSPFQWGLGAVIAAVLLVLGANAGRLWKTLQVHRATADPARFPSFAATILYDRMLRNLSRRGLRKSPTQTPAEFVTSIQRPLVRLHVAKFTEHYQRARFGGSSEDAERLPKLYEEVLASTKEG